MWYSLEENGGNESLDSNNLDTSNYVTPRAEPGGVVAVKAKCWVIKSAVGNLVQGFLSAFLIKNSEAYTVTLPNVT